MRAARTEKPVASADRSWMIAHSVRDEVIVIRGSQKKTFNFDVTLGARHTAIRAWRLTFGA
jgi:hypothetical protein